MEFPPGKTSPKLFGEVIPGGNLKGMSYLYIEPLLA